MGHSKSEDGLYHIKGHTYEILVGSRAQVMNGTAYKTPGGLVKVNLLRNKNGRIVSKKKHLYEKSKKRLLKHGYGTEKGKFGAVKIFTRSKSRRRHRGGASSGTPHFTPGTHATTSFTNSASNTHGDASPHSSHGTLLKGGKKRRTRGGMGASLSDAYSGSVHSSGSTTGVVPSTHPTVLTNSHPMNHA